MSTTEFEKGSKVRINSPGHKMHRNYGVDSGVSISGVSKMREPDEVNFKLRFYVVFIDNDRSMSEPELYDREQLIDGSFPNCDKIGEMTRAGKVAIENTFPNTIFNNDGLLRMFECIGFLAGMIASGKKEVAESLAASLFNAFRIGMNDHKDEKYKAHPSKLVVNFDSDFLCFWFNYYHFVDPVVLNTATTEQIGQLVKFPKDKGEYGEKHYYYRAMNGGIIFHGLREVYSVSLTGKNGWQCHT